VGTGRQDDQAGCRQQGESSLSPANGDSVAMAFINVVGLHCDFRRSKSPASLVMHVCGMNHGQDRASGVPHRSVADDGGADKSGRTDEKNAHENSPSIV
jgi:hypothetical protein